jgi:hypothetical protein
MLVCCITAFAEINLTELSQLCVMTFGICAIAAFLIFFLAAELIHLVTEFAVKSQRTNLSDNASFFFRSLWSQNITVILI